MLYKSVLVVACCHVLTARAFAPAGFFQMTNLRQINNNKPGPLVSASRRPHSTLAASSVSSFIDTGTLSKVALDELDSKGYTVISNFISPELQQGLRNDIQQLRANNNFRVAKIGQDATNTLNQDIRVAETCFIDNSSASRPKQGNAARDQLYQVLSQVRTDLAKHSNINLDANLDELLYAYYPKGGFYRRHQDAVQGSASVLRCYSLLLYLNTPEWNDRDGGQLRIHLDSGGDFLPDNQEPNFVNVLPKGGTLVLFESAKIPHEVLDTQKERMAVVGWYNRQVTAGDIQNLGGGGGPSVALLAASAGLVTVGLIMALNQ